MVISKAPMLNDTEANVLQTSSQDPKHSHNIVQKNLVDFAVVDPRVGSLGRKTTEMGKISPLRCAQSGRLFVSAILSLISILISPVLSTDAMWNVITDATGTGLETSMANSVLLAGFYSLSTGSTYSFPVFSGQANTTSTSPDVESFHYFRWNTSSPLKLGVQSRSSIIRHSVDLQEFWNLERGRTLFLLL